MANKISNIGFIHLSGNNNTARIYFNKKEPNKLLIKKIYAALYSLDKINNSNVFLQLRETFTQ